MTVRSDLHVTAYRSTRSSVSTYTFAHAITTGYAPDRGLFVPTTDLPLFTETMLKEMKGMAFDELAFAILRRFIPRAEMSNADLLLIIAKSYKAFMSPSRVNVVKPSTSPICIAELFHGPTFCFKDLGLSMLCNLISHFTPANGPSKRTLCVSTTGDTGPAAVAAVVSAGNPNLNIMAFYPRGQISEFQKKQMLQYSHSPGVTVVEFEGGGDDMDSPLKRLGADPECKTAGICGANSYNIGRPLAQLVHFFWSVFRAQDMFGLSDVTPIDIVIPTGAMGNMTACYMAKKCGLPVGMMTAATNVNDITHRCFSEGDFSRCEMMQKTLSDAINIQVPYNMERVLYFASGRDSERIASWYQGMESHGAIKVDSTFLLTLQEEFRSARIDDETMCEEMRKYLQEFGYLCDPHTSVAVGAARMLGYMDEGGGKNANKACVMATASPCKFEESVGIAIGKEGWREYRESSAYPGGGMGDGELAAVFERASGDGAEETTVLWMSKVKELLLRN